MRDDGPRRAGKVSLWLSSLFVVIMLPLSIVNLLLPIPFELPLGLVASYLIATLGAFFAYMYGRMETVLDRQERILHQPVQGVEVFRTSKEFIEKLIEITIGAESVSTLNLSSPKGEHPYLDRYFSEVGHYVKSRRSPLESFRSIASVDSANKISWILERSVDQASTGRVSFSIFDQRETAALLHPLSLHITRKDGNTFVFIFPPVDLTGEMDSILIKNPAVARVMVDYFNLLWHRAIPVNVGRQVRPEGLAKLLSLDPSLEGNPHFNLLREASQKS